MVFPWLQKLLALAFFLFILLKVREFDLLTCDDAISEKENEARDAVRRRSPRRAFVEGFSTVILLDNVSFVFFSILFYSNYSILFYVLFCFVLFYHVRVLPPCG